jgi:hypothetical protein
MMATMRSEASRRALILALLLTAGPATGAPPRCQVVSATEARLRLDVWGRELAGAKGAVTARAARHAAIVQTRGGTVLEALFLVALQETGDPARSGASLSRPQWVRCTRWEADPWR